MIAYTMEEKTSWTLSSGRKMASPKRKETTDWLGKFLGEFPPKILRNAVQGFRCIYEEGAYNEFELESKSEIDSIPNLRSKQ